MFWIPFYKKKNTRAFNVARPRQRNIYQITSTCNLHAYRQASELRLNSFFISTTLLSFEQLIHLDYFIWRRVGWWRDGFLVASWLVARWPDTVTRVRDTSAGTGKLCILGHLGLVFIWSCFVSYLLFLLFYVSLRNLCSGTCRKIQGWRQ